MSAMVKLDDLLEKTSRTFALSIPMLPEPTRRHVEIAYLLFRVADTFEDAVLWPRASRIAALDDLAVLLETRGGEEEASRRWLDEVPLKHAGYLELLHETPAVLEAYWEMPAAARRALARDLLRTVRGMADVVRRGDERGNLRLGSVRELRDYCYVVAGIVGEMLTELFLVDHAALAPVAERLRRRSRFFGEGLQLVNILKDAASDATEGRVYLPATVTRDAVFAIARRDLSLAAGYVRTLKRAGAADGLIAFTGSPAILARASLDRIESAGPGAKLTRPEVASLMERMFDDLAAGRDVI
ncbi:MAG TPA: squalene/phytoene synthase family protein [Candidatus Polarisedimenticolaceae bacterium]|nr:squalene/phytoene synthase family protein [Candidatus Polarisedimenticolaceae bacterium]